MKIIFQLQFIHILINGCCCLYLLKRCLSSTDSTVAVVTFENEEYQTLNYQWNVRNKIYPKAFLVPSSENDIQEIVKCASASGKRLAIKCGGHSFEKYSFGTGVELVVDLSRMKGIEVNHESRTALIQSGFINGELSTVLLKKGNYMLPTGNCPSVGVSGYTLGGGIGFAARTFGLMIDYVEELNIVISNGSSITTNANLNSDLFWAALGAGGGNFGIVTRFKFRLIPAPLQTIAIVKTYNTKEFEKVFTAWQNWCKSEPHESVSSSLAYLAGVYILVEIIIVDNDEAVREQQLSKVKEVFPDIRDSPSIPEAEKEVFRTSYAETLNLVYLPIPRYYYFKSSNYFLSKCLNRDEIKIFVDAVKKFQEGAVILMDMLGGRIKSNAEQHDTAYIHRDEKFELQMDIVLPFDGSIPIEVIRFIGELKKPMIDRFLKETKCIDSGFSYQNYVDNNRKDWKKRYYGRVYPRLLEIKKKYDPHHFFQCQQCIR